MLTLVIGGSASGKSEFAEGLILQSSARPRVYLATMEPFGPEGAARVARHRAMRAEKGFVTVERYTDLAGAEVPEGCAALLECMGNLTANELYSPNGAGEDAESAILRGIDRLLARCADLVVVSNEVFTGGQDYAGDTGRYLQVLAAVDRAVAQRADRVAEVVCGQVIWYKGAER